MENFLNDITKKTKEVSWKDMGHALMVSNEGIRDIQRNYDVGTEKLKAIYRKFVILNSHMKVQDYVDKITAALYLINYRDLAVEFSKLFSKNNKMK